MHAALKVFALALLTTVALHAQADVMTSGSIACYKGSDNFSVYIDATSQSVAFDATLDGKPYSFSLTPNAFGAPFSHFSLEAGEWYVHIVTGSQFQPIISGVDLKIAVDASGSKKLLSALITNGYATYDVSEFNGQGCY